MRNRIAAVAAVAISALPLVPVSVWATDVGEDAPAFVLASAKGDTVALRDFRGRVVYVDFWASWCAPCRRSFPWMNQMQQRYGERGLTIIGVNVDRRRPDAQGFLQANAAGFTVVYDDAGATPLAYSVKGMPTSYLIDQRGTVVDVEQGFRDDRKDAVEAQIRSLLSIR